MNRPWFAPSICKGDLRDRAGRGRQKWCDNFGAPWGYVPVLAERQLDGTVCKARHCEEHTVNKIIWWVGAIVIILAILGSLGFR